MFLGCWPGADLCRSLSINMEDLRTQIYACREKNHESRYFIPDKK